MASEFFEFEKLVLDSYGQLLGNIHKHAGIRNSENGDTHL